MPQRVTTCFTWFIAGSLLLAALPGIAAPQPVLDVTRAGVVGDGVTLNTGRIQKAIDECAAAGGGTLRFPAGRYLTGTLQLKSHVTLRLEEQATLLGSPNAADYRNLDAFTDGIGNPMGYALIVALDADHVGLEGPGTIDGQGPSLEARQKPYTIRPFLVRWLRCTHITVRALHLINSGAWTMHFFQSQGARVDGVTIRARQAKLRNNDGIDIDSSTDVQVSHCDIDSGDDALVIKSTSAKPSRDITATHCKFSSHCNAIKLGTESLGGFENIEVSDCTVTNTQLAGIALYTVDGGDLRQVRISDIAMDGVLVPICVRLGSRLKVFHAGDQPKPTGQLREVTLKNVSAKDVGLIGILISGVPNHPVEALSLENIRLELPGGGTAEAAKIKLPEKPSAYPECQMFGKVLPAYGIYARHVRGISFQNVQAKLLQPDARPAAVVVDVQDMAPADFLSTFAHAN